MDYTIPSWEDIARERQQEWYEVFGDRDWDKYDLNSSLEECCFMQNVGHAIYGLPDEEPSDENYKTGYSKEKIKHIQLLCHTIGNQHKNQCVFIGIVFVYMQLDIEDLSHVPTVIFRVMKHDEKNGDSNTFIDIGCRVYVSWVDFLKNNKLPKCVYCYPCSGVYNGNEHDKVLVEFAVTPAGKLKSKVLNGIDIAGTVVSMGSTVVTAAALVVPVTAPILMATAVSGAVVGVYGVGRNVENIVDRKMHCQSIGLKDSTSRGIWLSLGANVTGMVAAGATKFTSVWARSGNVLGRTGQLAVNVSQISSITLNGVNIVNTVFVLHQKHQTNSISSLDIFQLSASILFFSNSVVNFKLAENIIQESQQSTLQNFSNRLRSNRHMKAFARLSRNTREGLDPMHGNAKIIRSINQISNVDGFFSGVLRTQKEFGKNQAKVSFNDSGHIVINKDLIVDPIKFADVGKSQRDIILQASRKFTEGSINRSQYEAIVRPVLDEHGLILDPKSTSQVCSAFGVNALADVKVCGRSVLAKLRPEDVELLMRIMGRLISPLIVPTAIKVAEDLKLDIVVDFLHFLEFFVEFIKQLLQEMEDVYWNMVNIFCQSPGFNQAQFDCDNGIRENRQQQFLDTILKLFSIGKKVLELGKAYEQYKNNGYRFEKGCVFEDERTSFFSFRS